MNKILTIAIPSRNRDKYLIETVDSIIKQEKFNEIEIIICNNSDIKTTIIKNKYINYDNIIYFENKELLNIDENMIKVANLVNTKYFLWLGDDDFLITGGLKKILEIITNHEYDFVLLNAMMVTEKLDKNIGNTIKINENKIYSHPKDFFLEHCFHMPFGTLIIKKNMYDIVIENNQRFIGTSHAYSGLVFDYLAKQYLKYKKVNIIVVKEELIQLRQIEKSWKNNATKIMFQEIPEWFLSLDTYYKNEINTILSTYVNKQFKIRNLLSHRIKSQLNIREFKKYTIHASFLQKIKYLLVSLIPTMTKKEK